MNSKIILLFIGFIVCQFSVAQHKEHTYLHQNIKINTTRSLFGDQVKLRAEPNTTSDVVTLLRIGHDIKILAKTKVIYEDNTSKTAWYKVDYQGKKGFIPGKFIAHASKSTKEADFYFREIQNNDHPSLLIRTVYNKSDFEYKESSFDLIGYNISIGIEDHKNLKDVLLIMTINYGGESCGAESGRSYVFLNRNFDLIHIADLSEIGDGDVYFISETFTFTQGANGHNIILFTVEEGEEIEEETRWFETKKMTRQYIWNGKKLVPDFTKNLKKETPQINITNIHEIDFS